MSERIRSALNSLRPMPPTPAPQPLMSGADARPLLIFAHANGFPAGSYHKLFVMLDPHFQVLAPPQFGHDPAHPVSDGWPQLQRELLGFVLHHAHGRKVVLVGHSLGGFLSLMLARAHPELARCVVLLDSPVIAGWRAGALWWAKRTGVIRRLDPVAPALRRKQEWPDVQAVIAHFARKAAFARWDPEMLADYAEAGTLQRGNKRVLAFDRDVEARIYATLPHRLGRLTRPPGDVPVGFIGGTASRELRMAGMAATRRLVGAHLRWIAGGSHLFPFEQPQLTAEAIMAMVHELVRD